jgi:HK97 family phage major capsid protein
MNREQGIIRLKSIEVDVEAAYQDLKAGRIGEKKFNEVMTAAEKESAKIRTAVRTRDKAMGYASCSSPGEFDPRSDMYNPSTQRLKAGVKQQNLSPADVSREDMYAMFTAAKHKQPFMATVTSKGLSDARFKAPGAPVFEGAPYPSGLLPPVIQPGLTMGLRYESTVMRLADHLPTITLDVPSIEYLAHTGDTNLPSSGGVTAEGGVKVDMGQQWVTKSATPIKLAALASASMELLQDFSEFAGFLQRDLCNALFDAENDQLVLGVSPGMTGLLSIPGVLTRTFNASTDVFGLDTIIQAYKDIRVGTAKGKADLVLLNPATWDNLRRSKTTTNQYVLSIANPGDIGSLDNIFGVPVLESHWIPGGTAVVLDSNLACRYYVRQALTVETNPWGDTEWQTNTIGFRAEMRSTLAALYPQAICLVTGMPTDPGIS